MQTEKQAIKVTRVAEGWTWTLIDSDGGVSAHGAAAKQLDAMEVAWRTARSFTDGRSTPYPEIVVEQSLTDHQSNCRRRRRLLRRVRPQRATGV
jgi:hypothetical protein